MTISHTAVRVFGLVLRVIERSEIKRFGRTCAQLATGGSRLGDFHGDGWMKVAPSPTLEVDRESASSHAFPLLLLPPMPDAFVDRLRDIQTDKESVVCVGLDPDPDRLPAPLRGAESTAEAVGDFCRAIVEATADVACAFKLNFAFFEALGPQGALVLQEVAASIPEGCIVIGDAKRGDIGNSARFYAEAVFDRMHCDAITVAPYMGHDSVTPFLDRDGTCAFVLARTSNPGASDLQEACTCDGELLYLRTARLAAEWNEDNDGTAGLVAGATSPQALAELRYVCPTLPFLVPGVGSQGGDPGGVMTAAATDEGRVIVNSSRSIIYASDGDDYAEAAATAAHSLRDVLQG